MQFFPSPTCTVEIPEFAPVMALPDCNLFPHTVMPLVIFERRYRKMLAEALDSNRMFCMGMQKLAKGQPCGVHDYSTIGLIRACVGNADGTSHLLLEGIKRVRLVEFCEETKPYPIARICPVPTARPHAEKQEMLLSALREQFCRLSKGCHISEPLYRAIMECPCPEKLADILSWCVIKDALMQQLLLGTECLVKRTELLLHCLQQAGGGEEELCLG